MPINGGIPGERSVRRKCSHSFRSTEGNVQCSWTCLFPFQVAWINNEVAEHVFGIKTSLKSLKFMYGSCPRNLQRTPHDLAAPFSTEGGPRWDWHVLNTKKVERKVCCNVVWYPLEIPWATTMHKFQVFEAGFDAKYMFRYLIVDPGDLKWEKNMSRSTVRCHP